jgi:uncharacterized repeat protein (TIGR02543 family)
VGDSFTLAAGVNTLFAQWVPDAAALGFDANGGTGTTAPIAGVAEQVVTVPASGFTRAGWTFTGWNTAPDGSGTPYAVGASFTLAAGANALFAQWSADAAELVYDANTGSGVTGPTTGVTDQVVTVADNAFTKPGYTFAGWNTASDGLGTSLAPGGDFTLTPGTTTVYALWRPDPATLVYGSNGGVGTMDPASGVTDQTVTIAANAFTRDGYTFTGWNTAADGTGTAYAAGDTFTLAPGTSVLQAQWTPDPATLSFDANGGTGTATDITGVTDQVVTLPASPFTKPGYTFAGWNTTRDGTGTSLAPGGLYGLPVGTTILYAQWLPQAASLNYHANGGTGTTESTLGVTDEIVTVAANAFTRDGYTFTGWNTAADGSGTSYQPGDLFTLTETATILYAQWTATNGGNSNGGGNNGGGNGTTDPPVITALPTTGPGNLNALLSTTALLLAAGTWLTLTQRHRRRSESHT